MEALFSALFHSISAFCNAGFSIYKDNLVGLRDSPVIMATVMSLIVLGGLGHMVLSELLHHGKSRLAGSVMTGPRSLSTHSRVVLPLFRSILDTCIKLRDLNHGTMYAASNRANKISVQAVFSISLIGAARHYQVAMVPM